MKKLLLWLLLPSVAVQAQTLEECQQAAERNYPLIRQYALIEKTTDLTVANIQKGYYPQVQVSAQATLQSDVMSWPTEMQTMMHQMGIDLVGLKKDQYKVGIDISQNVYDGGAIKSQKAVARQQGQVQAAQTEVTLYQIRQRVNEMYFALLLADEQLKLKADHQQLLRASEQKLSSMYQRGTAAESDYFAVKAERLNVEQQMTSLQAQRQTLARMLSTFCGMEVATPVKPVDYANLQAQTAEQRPELKMIDAQLRQTDMQEQSLNTALMPRLSVFAQGYYGYPGYNLFDDMLHHQWSLGGMIGARLTWNIGALYTRKNDKGKLALQRSSLDVQRETFLFNNQLEQLQQREAVERYRRLMADDEEIIQLRSSVRKAAESKLAHGIIDVNDLLKEINAENVARVQQTVHELEMLKEMCDLKFTKNN